MRATVYSSDMPMRAKVSRTWRPLPTGSPFALGPSGLTYIRPIVVAPRGLEQLLTEGQGNMAFCSGVGPRSTLSEPSSSSILPAQNPMLGPPISSIATVPANMMRSPHDSASPYFCLIGHISRLALSRFVLSGQLLSGSKRWRPPSQPPRPSYLQQCVSITTEKW